MSLFFHWKKDLQSSVVVFLVALPLCLGIALASQAPMSSGLIAGIIGGLVIGSLSGSPISVSGPAAGLTVIVIASLQKLGSFELFAVSVMLMGVFQILFGASRGGIVGDYFPSSVVRGMLAAIGLILILKQFPHAVGYDADYMGDESFDESGGENTFTRLMMMLRMTHPGAVLVSLLSLFLILGWEKLSLRGNRFFQLIPGALIAVLASIGLGLLFQGGKLELSSSHLVSLPENGLSGIRFHLPGWEALTNFNVLVTGVTLALVGSLESLLSVDAADKLDGGGRTTDKNRELIAQGIGNSISGFLGGLPITAVIVRTSANANAGAKSRLSAILHGVWLFLAVMLIPHLLNLIPLASLAVVLILVGYKLVKPKIIKEMYLKGPSQIIPFAVTVGAILFTDLLTGIAIGMVVGFFFVIRSNFQKAVVLVNDKDFFLIRFHKDVSFLQKALLQKMLRSIPEGSSVMIDGSNSVFVDNDIVDLVEDFMKRGPGQNISVILKKSTLALCPLFKEDGNGTN